MSSLQPKPPSHLAVVILSYPQDPNRLGDVAFVPEGMTAVLGRDAATDLSSDAAKNEIELAFARQRPGASRPTGPLTARTLSRRQLLLRAKGDKLHIENVGRTGVVIDSRDAHHAHIGCTIAIGKTLLLACTRRPEQLLPLAHYPKHLIAPEFGVRDGLGAAGESAFAWELRDQLAEASHRPDHVLLRGVTGSGRGFAARLVHALSNRAEITPVTVNAAALDPNDAAHLFTKPNDGFLATAANARTSLIIERADTLPSHVQALIADAVEIGTKTAAPDRLRLILTVDPRTDTTASPLFRAIVRDVEVPSFGARIEDLWAWFLAAGAETESMDVDRMTTLAAMVRRSGWPAIANSVPTPSIPILPESPDSDDDDDRPTFSGA